MEGGGNAPSPINPDNPMPGEHGAAGLDERFETAVRSRKASRTENHRTERSSASIPAAVSENNAGSETEGSGSNPGRLATRGSTFLFAGEEAPLTGQNPGFDEILASNGSETEGESPGEVIPARFDTERGSRISGTSRGEPVHGYRGSPDGSMLEANILNAIVRHARLMLGNGQSSATIVLEPPRLGKLKLEIVTENAKVAGKILVESKEVQDIIRNNLPELRQNLLQNGLQVESFDVQVGHNGGTDNWAQRENMESTAALFRVERVRARENGGDSAAPAQTRSRNTARSPGYLDVWM
jgi:flagellar hook-length control protein FliK